MLWRGCNLSWGGPKRSCREMAMASPPATSCPDSVQQQQRELLLRQVMSFWGKQGILAQAKDHANAGLLCLVTQSHLKCLHKAQCFAVQPYPHCSKCLFTYAEYIASEQQGEGFGDVIYIYLTPLTCGFQRALCTIISLASKPSIKEVLTFLSGRQGGLRCLLEC